MNLNLKIFKNKRIKLIKSTINNNHFKLINNYIIFFKIIILKTIEIFLNKITVIKI
jgi:hypothetical protein